MIESGTLILAIIAASLAGIIIGAALHKQFGNTGARSRELARELETMKEKNAEYQQGVADHFSKTATLLNDLTLQYRDIHQHLAQGAESLCNDDEGNSLLSGIPIELNLDSKPALTNNEESQVEPPRDYAPKEEPSQTGVLSEEFGLEKVRTTESTS